MIENGVAADAALNATSPDLATLEATLEHLKYLVYADPTFMQPIVGFTFSFEKLPGTRP